MFDFLAKLKKTKTADNDGGECQATSSSTISLTDCPSDNTAEDKAEQNPNESETLRCSGKKKQLKSNLFKKLG